MAARGKAGKAGKAPKTFTVRPVAYVRAPFKEIADDCWGDSTSEIILDKSRFSAKSFKGMGEYSHVMVIFLLDRISEKKVVMGSRHPRGRKDWPETGIFALRSKDRPNRIAVTVCKVVSVRGTTLRVRELDALDGTPVLDIKPYLEEFGPRGGKVRQPKWTRELMGGYFQKLKPAPRRKSPR